jgi:hypothetical protein
MILTHRISNLDSSNCLTGLALSENRINIWAFRSLTADFEFWIDDECVFAEPSWNLGELAEQLTDWFRKGMQKDFQYDCMDADQKDLFTFRKAGAHFLFYSNWENEEIEKPVIRTALMEFIQRYSADVEVRIKQDLGLDVSYYLSK